MSTNDATTYGQQGAWTDRRSRAFLILGIVAVVGGGLLSAIIAPTPSYVGSWAVAYIVLVGGAAQVALGVAQASVARRPLTRGILLTQVLLLNLGVAGTVVATVANIPVLLYLSAAAQVAAVIFLLAATRKGRPGAALITLRVVAIVLLIGSPTGVILQAVAS
ncbi:MAG TPA: hypothetical protein VFQ96_03810 [Microbacteriaceae bacterium]|nr:hypothetical protein [Microbacteriaceae bacterium]